ncbi:MAG: ankyrin repeat domain-containing protein, partial [Gammaproteobacteria bacterium]|nr:ankyrin repeat domain-containing protein [Gammaproteobacteria bacterium]
AVHRRVIDPYLLLVLIGVDSSARRSCGARDLPFVVFHVGSFTHVHSFEPGMPPRGKLTQAERRAARQREQDRAEAGGESVIEHVPQGPPCSRRNAARQSKLNAKLHAAAILGNTRRVADLINRGASVDSGDWSNDGRTALMLAATKGHTATVNALAGTHNANVEAVDERGRTALMFAAANGRTDTFNVLAGTHNANVEASDEDGGTALMFAAMKGHTATVNALAGTHNANVEAVNQSGMTALMLAAGYGHTDT